MKRYEGMIDDELVHLYAAGCNEAFNELLMRYDAYVHTYIRYSISDEDQVEDVFQEVFIKVMLTIRQGRYTAEGKFKSWLGRVAHNLVIDHFRRQKARGTSQPIESNDPDRHSRYPHQTLVLRRQSSSGSTSPTSVRVSAISLKSSRRSCAFATGRI